jgi:23S rRNA (adenine2503-C2)-methyltransferase
MTWSMAKKEWADLLGELGQPTFRSKQIWQWLYAKGAQSFDEMTNLPAALRTALAERLSLAPWAPLETVADEGGTTKLLLECEDGERIESVVIPSGGEAATLCVSTQAGCAFKCAFCATGQLGLSRNLEAGEIVGQLFAARAATSFHIDHLVFMGMGEPFANYDNVLKAVRIFNDQDGLAIGARRITLSTCGVVPGIKRLANEGLQVELAISLHAPDDALRSRLMPVNNRWPVAELIAACRDYNAATRRIVTFEYTLVDGLNDTRLCASALADLIDPSFARVNLIPLSPVAHFDGNRPSPARCEAFAAILRRRGINVTLRHSKGSALSAACGQLKGERGKEGTGNGERGTGNREQGMGGRMWNCENVETANSQCENGGNGEQGTGNRGKSVEV